MNLMFCCRNMAGHCRMGKRIINWMLGYCKDYIQIIKIMSYLKNLISYNSDKCELFCILLGASISKNNPPSHSYCGIHVSHLVLEDWFYTPQGEAEHGFPATDISLPLGNKSSRYKGTQGQALLRLIAKRGRSVQHDNNSMLLINCN